MINENKETCGYCRFSKFPPHMGQVKCKKFKTWENEEEDACTMFEPKINP